MSRSQSSQWSGAADHDGRNDESDASEHNDGGVPESATAHAYEVLGISHNASTKEVAKAYKELARIHHPDKSSCPQASETFKKIKEAYDTLMLMQANMDAEEDSTAEDSTAASAKRTAACLQTEFTPTFEVAYPSGWVVINEEISKEMYAAFSAKTPGFYTEPFSANGKEGTREYIVDWQQMIQTNIENGRQRSVRFHPHKSDDTNQHHRRILTGKMR